MFRLQQVWVNPALTVPDQATVVLQSHRLPLPHSWLEPCLRSVEHWAQSQGYSYRFVDDELFGLLTQEERAICAAQPVVASDLARLRLCQQVLAEGASRVVWCDADSLVIDASAVALVADGCAFGRELWLQETPADGARRPRLYRKIHNAFMQFSGSDPVLDFYEFAATRMLARHGENTQALPDKAGRSVVAQFLGPKFLSHLHNVVDFCVLEHAQVISPLLAQALLERETKLLDRYRAAWQTPAAVLNLCASEVLRGSLDDRQMRRLIEILQASGASAFSTKPTVHEKVGAGGVAFGRIAR